MGSEDRHTHSLDDSDIRKAPMAAHELIDSQTRLGYCPAAVKRAVREESVETITGVLKVVYDTDYRQFANELAPRADPSADTSSLRGKMFKRLKIDMSSQAMANEIDCVSG